MILPAITLDRETAEEQPGIEVEAAGEEIDPDGDEADESGESTASFGARMLEEYPIDTDDQATLDTMETDYSKVNWQVVYEPEPGIIVSEGTFVKEQKIGPASNHLIVAFTNLTGDHAKLSIEGYVENKDDDVIYDLIDNEVEIWAGNTVARDIDLQTEEASGNIKWNNITIEPSALKYAPYEVSPELTKKESGLYGIERNLYDVEAQCISGAFFETRQCGLILDDGGNIIYGIDSTDCGYLGLGVETFNGKNADVAYFCNSYKID